MGSVAACAVAGAGAGVRGADDTPGVPSVPVQIGTSGVVHHGHAEIGSWQSLILMFIAAIVIGAVVLLYVVRQRSKVLKRRRLRRTAEAPMPTLAPTPAPPTPAPALSAPKPTGITAPPPTRAARRPGPHRVI